MKERLGRRRLSPIPMLAILLSLMLAQSQGDAADRGTLIDQKLPFSPLKKSEMVVTGGGDGMGFYVLPTLTRAFDAEKEMPSLESSNDGKAKSAWEPKPVDYTISEDLLFRVLELKDGQSFYHNLQAIRYRQKKPWATLDRKIILFFDHKVFAICTTDPSDDEGPGDHSDVSLIQESNGHTVLDIGQYISGTGGFHSHAVFDLTASGPVLTKITEGGRGR